MQGKLLFVECEDRHCLFEAQQLRQSVLLQTSDHFLLNY